MAWKRLAYRLVGSFEFSLWFDFCSFPHILFIHSPINLCANAAICSLAFNRHFYFQFDSLSIHSDAKANWGSNNIQISAMLRAIKFKYLHSIQQQQTQQKAIEKNVVQLYACRKRNETVNGNLFVFIVEFSHLPPLPPVKRVRRRWMKWINFLYALVYFQMQLTLFNFKLFLNHFFLDCLLCYCL